MNKIESLIAKLDSITIEAFDQKLLAIVAEKQSEALDMNTAQLFSGQDSKYQSLGNYASQNYAAFKRSLNPAGVVDLKLMGGFYRGFYAKTDSFPIQFDSTDSKSEMLRAKYGDDIFGLDQNNLETFRQEIKPEIQDYLKSILSV